MRVLHGTGMDVPKMAFAKQGHALKGLFAARILAATRMNAALVRPDLPVILGQDPRHTGNAFARPNVPAKIAGVMAVAGHAVPVSIQQRAVLAIVHASLNVTVCNAVTMAAGDHAVLAPKGQPAVFPGNVLPARLIARANPAGLTAVADSAALVLLV